MSARFIHRGDTIARAKRALLVAMADFFPDPADRENFKTAVMKFDQLAGKARDLIRTKLNSPTLGQEMEAALSRVGDSFGNSPESSESTPDR